MDHPEHSKVIRVLEKFYPNLSTRFKTALPFKLVTVRFLKHQYILSYNEVQYLGIFILTGSAMELWVNPKTKTTTTCNFWFPNDFIYTNPGLFCQSPSPSYIQALEDTVCATILFSDFRKLKTRFTETDQLAENIRGYYDQQRREYEEDFHYPASYRVNKLETAHPEIYQLAELQHIAQYHKIDVRTLNRIRSNSLLKIS
jgi:hypothetical protein